MGAGVWRRVTSLSLQFERHRPHLRRPGSALACAAAQDAKRGFSAAAVFIARNRFAVLDRGANQLVIKDLANEVGGWVGWWADEVLCAVLVGGVPVERRAG